MAIAHTYAPRQPQRVFLVIKFWIERHRRDWSNEKLVLQLMNFISNIPEEFVAAFDMDCVVINGDADPDHRLSLEKTKLRYALDNRDKKLKRPDQTSAPDPKVSISDNWRDGAFNSSACRFPRTYLSSRPT